MSYVGIRKIRHKQRFPTEAACQFPVLPQVVLHELFQFLQVFVCIKGYALTFTAISTGAPRFLVVSFQAFFGIS